MTPGRAAVFGPAHLGLLHLHDVSLAVGDAVVDVVDVGRQRLHLLVERQHRLLRLRPLPQESVPLPEDLLLALGQLLPLLRDNTTADASSRPRVTVQPILFSTLSLRLCVCSHQSGKCESQHVVDSNVINTPKSPAEPLSNPTLQEVSLIPQTRLGCFCAFLHFPCRLCISHRVCQGIRSEALEEYKIHFVVRYFTCRVSLI